MEKIDYKKAFPDLYKPKTSPSAVEVPPMTFIMIDGKGNPNDPNGEYPSAVELLYGLSYTIKMNKKGETRPNGYFEYVVPPLEGLWSLDDPADFKSKEKFLWTSMIRQPEFVTAEVFAGACRMVEEKKKLDTSKARLELFSEGLCVQCMHIGPFDDEPSTLERMDAFIRENGFVHDFTGRRHHEIYLSDPRKTDPCKMKTILRVPVKKA